MKTIYTIGYEGADIDNVVATLKAAGVKVLADVRAVAVSRKKGFSKTALRSRLEREGIAYCHFVELGDPKSGREAARAGRYDVFRRIYARHLSQGDSQAALRALAESASKAPTCLLCFERDPAVCHRSMVASQLKNAGMRVLDLFGDSPHDYVGQSSSREGRHPRKGPAQPQPEIR